MATTSPSPNSSPNAVPPASTTPSPRSNSSSSSQPNASSPTATSTPSPPSQSPRSPNATTTPPASLSPPPSQPPMASPPHPTTSPPLSVSPSPPPPVEVTPASNLPGSSPPPPSSKPPLPSRSPPPSSPDPPPSSPLPPSPDSRSSSPPPPSPDPSSSSPPPPSLDPPSSSPPPPSRNLPAGSPPLPLSNPPASSPPPPSEPTKNSPPPPPKPPENSPPPPSSQPPEKSPPPPSLPPKISPPPPESKPRQSSPPPPTSKPPPKSMPPKNSPQTPIITPPPQASPRHSNSLRKSSPSPPPKIWLPPPPTLVSPLSPSQVPIPPSGNPTTNNTSSNTPENSNSRGNGGINTGGVVAIGLILGFILLSLIGTATWCMRKRKKMFARLSGGYVMPTSMRFSERSDSALVKVHTSATHIGSSSGSDFIYLPTEPGGLGNSRSWFTYEELVKATNGFSVQNKLGEGGFGSVYKGYLADGREIAVKQLKIGGGQGEREFRSEVEIISRIHHRHLVTLVGYCISDNQRLLVYDYVANNTLHFHLHGEGRPVMDWATRVKVAAGAARGMAYLHEDCHPRIIHRDIKSSNILLDTNFEARVSDFGLAKLALDANTHITTRVMGTFGYVAPEYASSGMLTEKSDVFSFGVVLLELITGRKPVDASQPLGEESLVEWARPLLAHALETREFEGVTDPRLEKNYIDGEMFRMIEAAAACVRHSAAKRPRMGQVVRAFDSMATADLTNGMRLGESEIYNSEQQSAEIRLFERMRFGSRDHSTDFFSQSSWNS